MSPLDLVLIAVTVALFAINVWFAIGCDRLTGAK
jgi:hypothetical protein